MTEPFPVFRYHPEPIVTRSVEASSIECLSCGRRRDYVYTGPVYATGEYVGVFCPWCIADGTAAAEFEAEFTDLGSGVPDDVPASVLDTLAHRTPGFESWQQDRWLYHCGDACAFLGRVGREDLDEFPEAIEMLLHENDGYGWTEDQSAAHVDGLAVESDTAAYLFRCLVCGAHQAFSDSA